MQNVKYNTDELNKIPIKLVAQRLGLKLNNKKCLCFLHNETTPSLSINTTRNIWKCFGCGAGGDVIKLVMCYSNYSFRDACLWLLNMDGRNHLPAIVNPENTIQQVPSKYAPDPAVFRWFIEKLQVTSKVIDFIKNRKYPESIVNKYKLKGIDDPKEIFETCKEKWGMERLLKCGLAKIKTYPESNRTNAGLVWWAPTMVVPFFNSEGEVMYLQGRTLDKNQKNKYKYVNLNRISTSLFNIPVLKTLNPNDSIVITEGITDCIASCLMGKPAVGIVGANSFKKSYVQLLSPFKINLIPDNDRAGIKFINQVRKGFQAVGKSVHIFTLDQEFKDISDYYKKSGCKYEFNS